LKDANTCVKKVDGCLDMVMSSNTKIYDELRPMCEKCLIDYNLFEGKCFYGC